MKRSITIISALLISICMNAQVGVGTITPADAAMLEVSSTSDAGVTRQGFMPPRVTTAQLADFPALTIADKGLMVYVSDADGGAGCLQIYDGAAWDCIDSGAGPAPTPISSQDFEAIPATPTLLYSPTGGALFDNLGIALYTPSGTTFTSGTRGYGVRNGVSSITFSPIDATSYSEAILTFNLASLSVNTTNGGDQGDTVEVLISTDNLVTTSLELMVRGFSNSRHDFSGTANATYTYDGDNSPRTFSYPVGGTLVAAEATTVVTLEGIPNTVTDIIIRVTNDNNNEVWLIDDVSLLGR